MMSDYATLIRPTTATKAAMLNEVKNLLFYRRSLFDNLKDYAGG